MSIDEVVGQHEAWQRLMQMEQEDLSLIHI